MLRHRQDAEDAAQQALIRIAQKAHSLREPRAFRLWLYRISVNSALMVRRARRPLPLDARSPDRSTPEDSRLREELVAAMDRLGDENRGLLVDHYFEKSTLEELGRRDGVSAAAVWKRLQFAKESLRALMAGAGASLALASIASALGKAPRVFAPANLVGPALLAKAGGAALLIGGTMAAKTLALHTIVLVALFCFAAGLGGGIWAGAAGPEAPPERKAPGSPTFEAGNLRTAPEPGGTSPAAPPDARPRSNRLQAELARFVEWLRTGSPPAEFVDYLPEMERRFPHLREDILADPSTYLRILEAESDPAILVRLTAVLQLERVIDFQGRSHYWTDRMTADMLPPELLEGLAGLLTSGSTAQQSAILNLTGSIYLPPPALAEAQAALLGHPDLRVRLDAVQAVARSLQPVQADHLPQLLSVSRELPHATRGFAFEAIARIPDPQVDELLARELTVPFDVRNGRAHQDIAGAVADRILRSGHLLNDVERERYLTAIGATLSRKEGFDRMECGLIKAAVRLSPPQARPILESVREKFSGGNLETLDRLLEQIAGGASRNELEETMSPWH